MPSRCRFGGLSFLHMYIALSRTCMVVAIRPTLVCLLGLLIISDKMGFFQSIVTLTCCALKQDGLPGRAQISLAVFQMNCLQCVYGISLREHVPNANIMIRCNTLSVGSQLQSNRLRWLGQVCRMTRTRLHKKQVKPKVSTL